MTTTPDSDRPMVIDSDQSERALDAYDAIPGDSESKVDYPSDDHPAVKECSTVNNYGGLLGVAKDYFELEVEMTVRLPDGTVLVYREGSEKTGADDYDFPEALALVDVVSAVLRNRLL